MENGGFYKEDHIIEQALEIEGFLYPSDILEHLRFSSLTVITCMPNIYKYDRALSSLFFFYKPHPHWNSIELIPLIKWCQHIGCRAAAD